MDSSSFQSRWTTLREDEIERPNGYAGSYAVIVKRRAPLVIPWDGEELHLVRQWRYPTAAWSIEFPQGTLSGPPGATQQPEHDDPPHVIAATELKEELGMTAAELTAMYSNKSWDWGKGHAAFFRDDGGFWAWTGEGSYAEGTWKANNLGVLCFSAFWTSPQGRFPARTCFAHLVGANGTIYQRKLPNGEWALFEHTPPQPGDAGTALVDKNLVLGNFVALRKRQAEDGAAPD